MKVFKYLVLLAIIASVAVVGCGKKEEQASQGGGESPHDTGEIPLEEQYALPGPAEVMVPDDVKAAWKSVLIEVIDNESGTKQTVTVDIGQVVEVEGTGLKVNVTSFLPAFQMDGPIITSRSNEPENPAAQIVVLEGENEIFKGWLFTLYPTTHSFTHPKYSISLLEGIAAEKG